MISLIEAKNFRCLRYIRQPLGEFHVLVGPNASGKTTFLDVVAFLGKLVSDGPENAVHERTQNFQDLLYCGTGDGFELAIEAKIPEGLVCLLRDKGCDTVFHNTIRYEIALKIDKITNKIEIVSEKVLLKMTPHMRPLFPPVTIITNSRTKYVYRVITNSSVGNSYFLRPEICSTKNKRKGWLSGFMHRSRKSALGNLPEDESRFPVSTWLKGLLVHGVQQVMLNSLLIRKASPPGQTHGFKTDGSNLPWVIDRLKKTNPKSFKSWIKHLRTALPDLENIKTIERSDDKHRYLVIHYRGGLKVPSWMVSDGTLRLLALTLPAYLPEFKGVYLIEEPENGIHPQAVETVFQSLSSAYSAQILMATHSPVILSMVEANKVLCFAKTTEGATDIILGSEHPALKDWKKETSLGVLFASGVLG